MPGQIGGVDLRACGEGDLPFPFIVRRPFPQYRAIGLRLHPADVVQPPAGLHSAEIDKGKQDGPLNIPLVAEAGTARFHLGQIGHQIGGEKHAVVGIGPRRPPGFLPQGHHQGRQFIERLLEKDIKFRRGRVCPLRCRRVGWAWVGASLRRPGVDADGGRVLWVMAPFAPQHVAQPRQKAVVQVVVERRPGAEAPPGLLQDHVHGFRALELRHGQLADAGLFADPDGQMGDAAKGKICGRQDGHVSPESLHLGDGLQNRRPRTVVQVLKAGLLGLGIVQKFAPLRRFPRREPLNGTPALFEGQPQTAPLRPVVQNLLAQSGDQRHQHIAGQAPLLGVEGGGRPAQLVHHRQKGVLKARLRQLDKGT